MVKAVFTQPTDESFEMRVIGHAGFAEAGRDPVCAGASVLAFTAAQCIDTMREQLQKKPVIRISGGNVRVIAKPKPEYRANVKQVFLIAQVGYALLQEAYPGSVEVTLFEPE